MAEDCLTPQRQGEIHIIYLDMSICTSSHTSQRTSEHGSLLLKIDVDI